MALGKAEWRRRVAAACALHGIDLADLDELEGLPKHAARRAGHKSDTYQPNHALAVMLAERLDLPVGMFEDEGWRPGDGVSDPQLTAINRKLDLIMERLGIGEEPVEDSESAIKATEEIAAELSQEPDHSELPDTGSQPASGS